MKNLIVLKQNKPFLTSVSEDSDWDEVINFTKIKKGGVNIKELLSVL